jgi:crotonobetainyl-CoA:carnitine CoA-transferase CaiB-like acyl-CoA transferase
VIEIGQFTTAPLAARHLACFGADVIKVEPQGGDSARAWAPHRDGTSLFFVLSNGTKRSAALDLGSDAGRAAFATLVAGADVLVENMKPGSLARLGFSAERLRSLNPRLVYCAISGFGAHSVYAGRPAFDTVVQAMSGMMDATQVDGVPMKSGISAADIGGGQTGLLAIVAALVQRDRTGRGATIDIAMQDVGAWLTQLRWNAAAPPASWSGPVATVAEACAHPQTLARGLIVKRRDSAGTEWELLGSPLRLTVTPASIGPPLGRPQPEVPAWRDDCVGEERARGAAAMR